MEEQDNKTIMCSVLFLDIVGYSKKPVSGQIALKEGFNALLSIAIRDMPIDDRIILDTGDGAVISFLGDIESALKAALIMRASLLSAGAIMDPPLLVRMGINLGPVRLVKDINGLPNIVGDGINVAQRVMGFADASQILVSQSYFDAVSRLSQEYATMFHYEGARTDKHVREHQVYAIGYPGEFTETQRRLALSAGQDDSILAKARSYGRVAAYRLNIWSQLAYMAFRRAPVPQRILYLGALITLLALAIALVINAAISPSKPDLVAEEQAQNAPGTPVAGAAQSAVEAAKPQETKKTFKKHARVRTVEETTAIHSGAARVTLAIKPWGEIYLNGRIQGISPPLVELQVVPGEHRIEVRNANFPVYSRKFKVKANGRIKISHTFGNKDK